MSFETQRIPEINGPSHSSKYTRGRGLLLARLRRADSEPGGAHDAFVLAQEIECLGGFLGEADDALGSLELVAAHDGDAR
jgi:hypothetical protein